VLPSLLKSKQRSAILDKTETPPTRWSGIRRNERRRSGGGSDCSTND